MKIFFLSLLLTFLTPATTFSQGKSEVGKETKEEEKNQGRRRKKVMMCHECGKPETECDCEGEGHGVQDDDNSEKDSAN